jgi:hypothetical protein
MKTSLRRLVQASALGLTLLLASCVSPYAGPHERDGSVIGAVGGGTVGAIIGNQSGRPLEGAAIGGVLGALAGSSIGANQDRYYYGGGPVYGRPVHYRRVYHSYGPRPYYPGYYRRPYHRSYYY